MKMNVKSIWFAFLLCWIPCLLNSSPRFYLSKVTNLCSQKVLFYQAKTIDHDPDKAVEMQKPQILQPETAIALNCECGPLICACQFSEKVYPEKEPRLVKVVYSNDFGEIIIRQKDGGLNGYFLPPKRGPERAYNIEIYIDKQRCIGLIIRSILSKEVLHPRPHTS